VPKIFWVPTDAPGRLAVVGRPRAGHFLGDDMRAYRAAGLDTLVSALPLEEATKCWLHEEGAAAAAAGLTFLHFPVPNLLTPEPVAALTALAPLAAAVREGRAVGAHCFAGVGRSPLIVASILALLGIDPDEAWRRVARARGRDVPDTHLQRAWVATLVAIRPIA